MQEIAFAFVATLVQRCPFRREIPVNIAVRIEPAEGQTIADVQYRWDADTDILTASLAGAAPRHGMSGSVEIMGSDSSCLVLDVAQGGINGVEVAVWPDVRRRTALAPPAPIENVMVTVPARASQPGVAAVEVEAPLLAESDPSERTIHFRLGAPKATRVVRIARDVLLEVDERSRIAGVWLLNVPPFPDPQ